MLVLQFSDNGLDFLALKWDNKMFSDLSMQLLCKDKNVFLLYVHAMLNTTGC